uniref:Uncharacterized protein n=1 Tax=Anguilla anguilla TaxID=7936 RepID=A0A0E9UK95_ANGAN
MSSKVQSMLTAMYHLALENMDQIARTNEESSKELSANITTTIS